MIDKKVENGGFNAQGDNNEIIIKERIKNELQLGIFIGAIAMFVISIICITI